MNRANGHQSDIEFIKQIADYVWRWCLFVWERFNPPSHLVMIGLFTLGTATLADIHLGMNIIWGGVLATFFFMRLRLFDEIKDYETDISVNPTRPLPRGLLTIFDLKFALIVLILFEAYLVMNYLTSAMLTWSIAAVWSLFMYKEFFIPELIRPHLTTYATSHTLVTLPLTLALITGMSGSPMLHMNEYWAALGAWLVFNIFELGRKTFQPMEEREGVESYSLIWGRVGATVLVLVHAALVAFAFIKAANNESVQVAMFVCFAFLLICALCYLIKVESWSGKLWRIASSLYIILVYGALALIPYAR